MYRCCVVLLSGVTDSIENLSITSEKRRPAPPTSITGRIKLARRVIAHPRLAWIDSSDRALLRNMSWLTLVSGAERFGGAVQTVLVARAIGIAEYGVYGLMFGTIGLAASLAAIQMGLTATVFVARYRETDRAKASFVISFASRFSLAIAFLFLLVALPFSRSIGLWLLGTVDPAKTAVVVVGCIIVAVSIVSGVQEGVVQGLEDFRSTALARFATTLVTATLVYPAGTAFGLMGVLSVVVVGALVRLVYLSRRLAQERLAHGIPERGAGLRASDLLWSFSIPSVLMSALTGIVGWTGSLVLSRQAGGFEGVALVMTGTQWRGPILLMAAAASTVAVPVMSRRFEQADIAGVRRLLRRMLVSNGAIALLASLGLVAASPMILALYGPGFETGVYVFCLLVVSSVPQVIAGVYLQQSVATGRMWQLLLIHLWLVLPLGIGYVTIVPQLQSLGFAVTEVCAWSTFAAALALTGRPNATSLSVEAESIQVA
jgi:O-antigen/teichoic acid export membrane protein